VEGGYKLQGTLVSVLSRPPLSGQRQMCPVLFAELLRQSLVRYFGSYLFN
jgi:hypothetical protein